MDSTSALQTFQFSRFIVLILIGIVLVKSGYSTAEIALYELFFFISNFMSFAWVMGLKNAMLSYYHSLTETRKPLLFFNASLILLFLGMLAGSVLYVLKAPIALYWLDRLVIPHLDLVLMYIFLNAPSVMNEFILLLRDRPKEIIYYGASIFGMQLAGVALLAIWGFPVNYMLSFMVLLAFAKLVYHIVLLVRFARFKFDPGIIQPFVWFSFPLCLHMLVGNGMEYVDGFLVTSFFGEEDFAIFRYGAREFPLVTIWVGALTSAMIPLAVRDYSAGLNVLREKVSRLITLLFPMSIALMLFSPFLFEWVYNVDFLASANIFNIYLLILTSRIILVQVVLFSKHANRILLYSGMIELVLNVGLSLWLLQYFGLSGIAGATVIAYFANKLLLFWFSKKNFGLRWTEILPVRNYIIWSLLLVLSFIISMQYKWVL